MPSNEDLQFGRLALSRNLVTREELSAALQEQDRRRQSGAEAPTLGGVLVDMGLITQAQVDQILAEQSGAASSGGMAGPAGGGKMLGGYELLSKIGSGGMGTVYRARQVTLNRIVALKVLPQKLAKDKDFIARFYREARSVARLNHPNIVGGFDVGEADGYHYLAMEFVDGSSATAMLAEKPSGLPVRQVLDIAIQTAKALEHAHGHGVIHRDIKPENILISKSGEIKLCDLGLARSTAKDDLSITQTGIAVGTPHYISPEQARGEQELDPRTDIYSLGAALFHLLAGRPVFTGDNAMQIMLKHLHDRPPALSEANKSVPAEVSAVIAKCLAKRPEDRYPSARALIEDLEEVAAGRRPAHAPMTGPGAGSGGPSATRRHPTGKVSTAMMRAVAERRRRPMRMAVAAVAAAVLGMGLVFVLTGGWKGSGPEGDGTDKTHTENGPAQPDPIPVVPIAPRDKAKDLFETEIGRANV